MQLVYKERATEIWELVSNLIVIILQLISLNQPNLTNQNILSSFSTNFCISIVYLFIKRFHGV